MLLRPSACRSESGGERNDISRSGSAGSDDGASLAGYSGLLRMADLLALQSDMQIRLCIVAPEERREKVRQEIKRPVFSLLEHGPLYEKCTFLPYDAVHSIADTKFLAHMSDTILDEYEEGSGGRVVAARTMAVDPFRLSAARADSPAPSTLVTAVAPIYQLAESLTHVETNGPLVGYGPAAYSACQSQGRLV